MIAVMHPRNRALTASLVCLVLMLVGCTYRLYGFIPPSQELLQLVAKAPEQYALKVSTGDLKQDYGVPRRPRHDRYSVLSFSLRGLSVQRSQGGGVQ